MYSSKHRAQQQEGGWELTTFRALCPTEGQGAGMEELSRHVWDGWPEDMGAAEKLEKRQLQAEPSQRLILQIEATILMV